MVDDSNASGPRKTKKRRIGEELIDDGLINADQLQQVLKRQAQAGGKLGSILIEMGFVALDDLLELLSRKFGVPGVNLYQRRIAGDVLQMMPIEKMAALRVLPLAVEQQSLVLAMSNPQDFSVISELEFSLGKKIQPVVMPAFMIESAIRYVRANPGAGLQGEALSEMVEMEKGEKSPKLEALLRYLKKTNANDMIFSAGSPPSIKIANTLKRLAIPALTPEDCQNYAREMLTDEGWATFSEKTDHEFSVSYPDIGRFRGALYRQRESVSIVLRPIMDEVPELPQLNLPEWIAQFALRPQGLILISSPSGHGKTTTLSAMVDIINSRRGCHIITLEDPVEYLHAHKKSNISQREIGRDVESFAQGMRHILRQSPDVIVVGEMRDRETFRIALQAANSGHLVLSTAHSDNATSIIERIVNMFEPYEQHLIRLTLAESLLLSISQRLVARKDGKGRILALEHFINSNRMRGFVRDAKTHHIRTQMQTGSDDFSNIDISLAKQVRKGLIRLEDGLNHSEDEAFFRSLIQAHTPA
ncbi:PilT/PilU family type 4a pilus ATPase [uncultured Desulfosarcina sp.]|uniref:PilT/PilU family type 4a pilus ATPase n=1 Tax=uncultured Desulfosarcina sp. TaxID=218289 RepID=UPI0029C80A56|nr:PilT/PilU family type 4a pilus ATPase [uncultured Desulfosarcina sp.]